MFVAKSKYEKLFREAQVAAALIEQLANLVLELREKHTAFSPDEIETLIRLCHPDKHGNSQASTRITVKLLEMHK